MDWDRARQLWNCGTNGRIEASALVLADLVWPFVRHDWGNGELMPVESQDNPYADVFDRDAGIDAIASKPGNVLAIANRVQDVESSWNTHTIRAKLVTGNETEMDKRLRAVNDGSMTAGIMIHSYINLERRRLLAVGVARSVDVMTLAAQHRLPDGDWPGHQWGAPVYKKRNPEDGTWFVVVSWLALGEAVVITKPGQMSLLP